MEYLEKLNSMKPIEVVDNLVILNNVKGQLKVMSIYYRVQQEENLEVRSAITKNIVNLDSKIGIMNYLLHEMRRQIYYYPQVHRQKKVDNFIIVVGSGMGDAYFCIGINKSNFIYIEFRCNQNARHIYERLWQDKENIDDRFDYLMEWDDSNLKVSSFLFYRNKNREQILKQSVRILKKYIDYFTKFTFSNKLKEECVEGE